MGRALALPIYYVYMIIETPSCIFTQTISIFVVSPLQGPPDRFRWSLRFEVDLLGSLLLEADEDVAHHRGTTLRGLADRTGPWDLGTWWYLVP